MIFETLPRFTNKLMWGASIGPFTYLITRVGKHHFNATAVLSHKPIRLGTFKSWSLAKKACERTHKLVEG